jgi:glycerophosphoryl diester phosphodiesterase
LSLQLFTGANIAKTLQDNDLIIIEGATVSIHNRTTGGLATLYQDSAGATPQANPFTADNTGHFSFYVATGEYKFTVTKGAVTGFVFFQVADIPPLGERGNPIPYDSLRELLNTDLSSTTFIVDQWIETKGRVEANDGGASLYQIKGIQSHNYETIIPLNASTTAVLVNGPRKRLGSGEVEISAHRGFTQLAVEGTMPAFSSALDYGANSLEADVQFTSDGYMVLFHDQDTVTNDLNVITGKIKDNTLAQVQTATYKEMNGNALQAYVKVPQLFELLNLGRMSGCRLHLEIKAYRTTADIDTLVQTIVDYGLEDSVVLHSFIYTDIARVRTLNKRIQISYLLQGLTGTDNGGTLRTDGMENIRRDKNAMVAMDLAVIDNPPNFPDAFVAAFQEAGVEVAAWTAVTSTDFMFARRNNVNVIISDLPYHYNQPLRIKHGESF